MARTLAVIPARGGSKGVKRKNIRLLGTKPLIAHTISAAKDCSGLDRLIVSTDDPEIAEVAKEYGAEVPFVRPAELASDTATSVDVLLHALEWCEKDDGVRYDFLVLLQPTAPLRSAVDIRETLSLLQEEPQAGSSITLTEVTDSHPYVLYQPNPEPNRFEHYVKGVAGMRRQDFPPFYRRTGAVYCVTREQLVSEKKIMSDTPLAHIMPFERSVNIDEECDLIIAEQLLVKSAS